MKDNKIEEALKVERLQKNFGGLQVLNRISLSVAPGERRAIIGPNGAGKTTFFNVITGELGSSGGKIVLFGEDITELPNFQRARRGMTRTFQKNNLFFDLTVLDNLILMLQQKHGHSGEWYRARRAKEYPHLYEEAIALLEKWELEQTQGRFVRELSYGEQRQVEILIGLAANPKLLLLDEPTAGMSAAETRRILELLQSLPREMTIMIIEHDMELVFGLADRVTVLHFGEVLADGLPDEIRSDVRVQDIYLGTEGETR